MLTEQRHLVGSFRRHLVRGDALVAAGRAQRPVRGAVVIAGSRLLGHGPAFRATRRGGEGQEVEDDATQA